jgi:hypothetical protein
MKFATFTMDQNFEILVKILYLENGIFFHFLIKPEQFYLSYLILKQIRTNLMIILDNLIFFKNLFFLIFCN